MMLSRFVRTQLIIFSILTVVGVVVMGVVYINVPAMFGIGTYEVTVDLEATGGLYQHSNVTYRGTNVGKVEEVRLTPTGVVAKLSIDSDYKIPADSVAWVKSVSAVGEQYVDLVPNTADGPDLADGDVIPVDRTKLPQDVGPMLDQADRLLASISDTRLRTVVDEAFKAFNGTGPDLQKLLDSARLLVQEAKANVDPTKILIDQIGPLLDTQIESSDAVRGWTRDLTRFADQLRASDPQLRSILENGPAAANEATALFQDLRPTLPLLLANLVSVGEVGVTYNKSIEQVLVVFPPLVAALLTAVRGPMEDGAIVDFLISVEDPPSCTTGFIPPTQWRSPADMSIPDTPSNTFCKVPQDSKIAVRGARNSPCMDAPGRRAPTVEMCKSGEPYVPEGINPPVTLPGQVTPSSYDNGGTVAKPRTAARQYDPATGTFIGPDGKVYSQPQLKNGSESEVSWQTMMVEQQG
ncbi:MCE family protein [Antrihabitans stalactiti]|uniref:MCE family protein n=1 Tax=Antrihabitans stalactiti TaxID=2584121 RepID=A0A848KFI2_9NOCA|nr:MlaD family protein [Antrihabitans stalactiti]NMN97059.1 MCE family protein [Antrihabitans stalactiti]